MPPVAPGSLKREEYAAVAAFILQQSSFQAGVQPLTAASPDLENIDLSKSNGSMAAPSQPSTPARLASSGVYTAAQAAHGKTLYSDSCLACHGGDLDGVEDAPSLAGKAFLAKWGGRPVGTLHAFIGKTMPPGNGGALGPVQEADIVSYILSRNNFPPGSAPLPTDPQGLSAITIDKASPTTGN